MKKASYTFGSLYLLAGLATPVHAANPYPSAGSCDGLPKVNVKTPAGTCVGVVASDLKMPRGVLPLSDAEIWVTEMGAWERNTGRLSRLVWQNGRYQRSTILDKLDRPHGIQLGKDGWVYIGEARRIIRVNPKALNDAGKITPQIVVDHLPDDGHHPLKQLLLDNEGNIYLSMGAKSNNCEGKDGQAAKYPCAESTGAQATASIWKITSPQNQTKTTVYARGLRNAMGMAWTANGTMIVTENGRDSINQADAKLSDVRLPHDELNVIANADNDYGWPYCYDNNRTNPEYRAQAGVCRTKQRPVMLLPAHSAPLGIAYYPQEGSIAALRGRYLIALHGYRDTGHRLIAVATDATGKPLGRTTEIIGAWARTDKQPMGAPVEARPSPSGKVYITDDRNEALLRLSNAR